MALTTFFWYWMGAQAEAIVQAREFTKATEVSCLAITKLDGKPRVAWSLHFDEFKFL